MFELSANDIAELNDEDLRALVGVGRFNPYKQTARRGWRTVF
jgi:hypothetical protein